MRLAIHPPSSTGSRRRAAGFSITELTLGLALGALVIGAVLVFTEGASRTLVSLTSQSSHNQFAGNGTEFMIQRIRAANTARVDTAGMTLTLGFDDNPDSDSNGDKVKWNDRDHFEEFRFVDDDNSLTTLKDNRINYRADTAISNSTTIVPAETRKLSGQPIFSVLNNSTVVITFGLLSTNASPFSQAIEIRTIAMLRNRLK